MKKYRVGILGATGMVGQRFITLLENHPWFTVTTLAASANSAGKTYEEAVSGRWKMNKPFSEKIKSVQIKNGEDITQIAKEVDFVFCCLGLEKEKIKILEEKYASKNIPVISTNSAHRFTDDVPMIMPEINPDHVKLIDIQRKNRGRKKGFIAVKPNCSIQSYVSLLTALQKFRPQKVHVVSLQAISGAGKTLQTWPDMIDNVNPCIDGEEEKSEKEPLKIWGKIKNNKIYPARNPEISATCIRVPVSDGHMAQVSVLFEKKPTKEHIIHAVINHTNPIASLHLPSAPKQFMQYFSQENRPQTKRDRDFENGMGISMGRLKRSILFDWNFIALSHNTIRGAAGGAILTAELLVKKGYIV